MLCLLRPCSFKNFWEQMTQTFSALPPRRALFSLSPLVWPLKSLASKRSCKKMPQNREDKENCVLRSLDVNVTLKAATPCKGDPGRQEVRRAADSACSTPSSPAGRQAFTQQDNPVFAAVGLSNGDGSRVGRLDGAQPKESVQQEVEELRRQLAALQPVTLVVNVADGELASSADADAAQQLQRSEAVRLELSRTAAQLKGRIACLEGAVSAGESKVRAQLQELEALKAMNKELEQQLRQAQQQIGVTPERSRAALQELQQKAARAEEGNQQYATRIARLQSVLTYDGAERSELQEYLALEYGVFAEEKHSWEQEAQELRETGVQAAAELAIVRSRLAEAEAALQQRQVEIEQLQTQLTEERAAAEVARASAGEWQARAEQYDRDRQQAAANVRKAEREVDLIAQENASFFRQVNYVRTRLTSQLPRLDAAVPDIAKLAKELQNWCDREAQQRVRGSGLTPR